MGGWDAALLAFVTVAVVLVLLVFGFALAIGTAQEQVVSTARARMGQVRRWGGVLLMAVGAWFIILTVFTDFFAGVFPV